MAPSGSVSEVKLFYVLVSIALLVPGIYGFFNIEPKFLFESIMSDLLAFVISIPLVVLLRKKIGINERNCRRRLLYAVCILAIAVQALVSMIGSTFSAQFLFETFIVYFILAGAPCLLLLAIWETVVSGSQSE